MNKFTALIILIIFAIMAMFVLPVVIVAVLIGKLQYASFVFRALDRLSDAMLGGDGSMTVSTRCAKSNSVLCKLLCKVLSATLETDHCRKQLGE